jgi:hypothetical protein
VPEPERAAGLPPPDESATTDEFLDQAPLPPRAPGQNLSHHPTAAGDTVDDDADPLRPYRVHELLTRHTQGKQRGRSAPDAGPIDAAPEMTVPDDFGRTPENGR